MCRCLQRLLRPKHNFPDPGRGPSH
jgi:hypothetical protein